MGIVVRLYLFVVNSNLRGNLCVVDNGYCL